MLVDKHDVQVLAIYHWACSHISHKTSTAHIRHIWVDNTVVIAQSLVNGGTVPGETPSLGLIVIMHGGKGVISQGNHIIYSREMQYLVSLNAKNHNIEHSDSVRSGPSQHLIAI